ARRRDRLDRQGVADVVQLEPAPRVRDRDAAESLFGGGMHDVARILAGFVDQRGAGDDDLGGEALDAIAEGTLFGGELENHPRSFSHENMKLFRVFVSVAGE